MISNTSQVVDFVNDKALLVERSISQTVCKESILRNRDNCNMQTGRTTDHVSILHVRVVRDHQLRLVEVRERF